MTYSNINEPKYSDRKNSIGDYGIFIAGSKKQRKQVKKQLERLSKNQDLESLLEIVQELLSEQPSLESLIDIPIPYYRPIKPRAFSSEKELDSYLSTTENVIEIDSLGSGAGWKILGAYDPDTDTIYVLRHLSAREKSYVLAHERAHRRRHYSGESQDEYIVDQEARSRIGYDPFNRYKTAA